MSEPPSNIRMFTPLSGMNIDSIYLTIGSPVLTTDVANHYWCGCLFRMKFPTLFLEDHNNSQCFMFTKMSWRWLAAKSKCKSTKNIGKRTTCGIADKLIRTISPHSQRESHKETVFRRFLLPILLVAHYRPKVEDGGHCGERCERLNHVGERAAAHEHGAHYVDVVAYGVD